MAASVANAVETRIERRELKRWGFKLRGVFGALIIGSFALLAVLSPPSIAEGSWPAVACDTLGWTIFLAGACFRFWATLYIGGRKTQTVVCEGPYSVCRNPLYVGTFLLWLAVAVFLKSATLVAGVAVGVVFYWFVTLPAEERVLRSMLGQPYDDYCRRVPRLWPKWSLFHTAPVIQVNVHSLVTEGRRAIRWVGLPVLAALLAHLRSQGGWPQWFNLP
jgi:protein-S-isoprenylcysteine O-methyltransferase Ste14